MGSRGERTVSAGKERIRDGLRTNGRGVLGRKRSGSTGSLEQLRERNRSQRESDLWVRIGGLMEVRDDLRVMGHVLQRRAAKSL